MLIASLGCSGSDDDEGAIKVALEGPLTGEQSSNGLDMLRGVQIAVSEVNASGGVLGRRVKLIEADDTTGLGLTIQPKNSQISPTEVSYIAALKPATVLMLIDPSAYTQGMADRLETGLAPQVVYASTYFPEGVLIAKALAAEALLGREAACFMGMANQDPAFVAAAGIADSRRCVFSGVPVRILRVTSAGGFTIVD